MFKNRYSHMVNDYYVRRLREIMEERRAKIDALKTKKDAEAYVKHVREAFRNSFPGMPSSKTPLKPEITGKDEYKDFFIEKVIFESRPGFKVTGNLYLPKNIKDNAPGVLGLCGHSDDGKAAEPYQSYSIGLAKRGFIVFIVDPISQGERKQFHKKDGLYIPGLCHGHNIMGNRLVLLDDFFGSWRLWDAVRALDYLISRPEVDKKRVGVTGNSGGGTLTTYVTAIDERVTMAAPSCFICSYLANIENELPSDAEQNPPGILTHGLDQIDMLMCYAPRPTLVMGQYDDFFDARYTRERFNDLRKVHKLLGSKDSSAIFIGPVGHGYSVENREAMYKWFMKHAGIKGSAKETDVVPAEAKKLFVTSKGDVIEKGSLKVFDITKIQADNLRKGRKKLTEQELIKTAAELLNIPKVKAAPHYKTLRYGNSPALPEEFKKKVDFAIETEKGIDIIAATFGPAHTMMHPPKGIVKLYVGNESSQDDIEKIKELKSLISDKIALVAVDPRGFGQSLAKTCGSKAFFEPYGADYLYAATGEMLCENYLGRRVFDVMRVMDFLCAGGATEVQLIGRGMGAIITAFAALLHKSKPKVKIINYLPSYQIIVDNPVFDWPLSAFPRGVLKYFDLPDVYKALGKRLTMEKPWNEYMTSPKNSKQ